MSGRRMPRQKPGLSVQSVGTPWSLITAACNKLRIERFNWDLAAEESNTKAPYSLIDEQFRMKRRYFNEADDALSQPWHRLNEYNQTGGTPWSWLNPPFGNISEWAEKCCLEAARGAFIAMLVPSSTGARWWVAHVHGHAYVLHLWGRVTFEGHDKPYPKDVSLCLYTPTGFKGVDFWDWRMDMGILLMEPSEIRGVPAGGIVSEEGVPF